MNKHLTDTSWNTILKSEFKKDYFIQLKKFLKVERSKAAGKQIYPPTREVFTAFNTNPFDRVKVVIIGQDPYHGPEQAHGLCFSVNKVDKLPPSLKNIYKELQSQYGYEPVDHGNLESWAKQGILMLNSVLTVEKSLPGSHRKKGWEQFTDQVIKSLNEQKEHLVFILWGRDAQKKAEQVDRSKHLVLESAHPSPFSVKKFYGNNHFKLTNKYLKKHSISEVNWQLQDKQSKLI